jgi:hypothetical protein
VAWWRRLFRFGAINAQNCWNRECQHGAEPDEPCSIRCLSLHDPFLHFL